MGHTEADTCRLDYTEPMQYSYGTGFVTGSSVKGVTQRHSLYVDP